VTRAAVVPGVAPLVAPAPPPPPAETAGGKGASTRVLPPAPCDPEKLAQVRALSVMPPLSLSLSLSHTHTHTHTHTHSLSFSLSLSLSL
jgi:hypothetical protein